MTLRVLQINLQHNKAATAAFCQFFLREGIDLALIQEPWLHHGRVAGLRDTLGELVYCTSLRDARTCIVVRKGINFITLNEFCTRDLTTVRFTWKYKGRKRCAIASSVYLPFDSRELPPSRDLELLVESTGAGSLQLILGCDANAHHRDGWGSSDINPRGESLLQFLVCNNLYICNEGNRPTFVTRARREVIDITVCSEGMLGVIDGWHVSQEASLSDHRYIRFNL
jgi:hypothetical protein